MAADLRRGDLAIRQGTGSAWHGELVFRRWDGGRMPAFGNRVHHSANHSTNTTHHPSRDDRRHQATIQAKNVN
jgi:hypothetical protein